MKYYLIAGEASGDLHGSRLMQSLKDQDQGARFRYWGGDLMAKVEDQPVKHYRDLAFMGFVEVVTNLRTILKNIAFCKEDILQFQPDALVLIDYPGFNLRIANWAKQQGITVFYYISPQVWAWHRSRVQKIKKCVDRLFVILPFEKKFYSKYDYEVEYVGHPLMDVIDQHPSKPEFRKEYGLNEQPIVALLPGSRKQEIERMLQVMLEAAGSFPDYQFVIAGAPSQEMSFYEAIMQECGLQVPVIPNQTYDLLREAHAALVTSGTATLETALFNVPEVVCYRGSPLSYQIAKRLVDIEYISLVNLIVDRPLLTELIQNDLHPERLKSALGTILDEQHRQQLFQGYEELRARLGKPGAAKRTASGIISYLQKS